MPYEQRITPQDYKKLCKVLEMDGCYFVNQEGSHLKYRKEQKEGRILTITVPRYKSGSSGSYKVNIASSKDVS